MKLQKHFQDEIEKPFSARFTIDPFLSKDLGPNAQSRNE